MFFQLHGPSLAKSKRALYYDRWHIIQSLDYDRWYIIQTLDYDRWYIIQSLDYDSTTPQKR